MIKGIDVSRWQGEIDWVKVSKTDVKFSFIKATEGIGYVDPMFRRNALGSDAVGLKVGFYHFLRPDNGKPEEEAQHFVDTVRGFKYEWLVCDVENSYGKDKNAVTAYTQKWLEVVEKKTGKKPLIYTYVSFAQTYLSSALTKYPLWLAHYVSGSKPSSKTPWGDNWVCWQYSDKGTVSGISGAVDLNWMKPEFFNQSKTGPVFKDVPVGHWAESYIKSVAKEGIMVGYNDGTFGLGKPVTREELAKVVAKLLEKGGAKG